MVKYLILFVALLFPTQGMAAWSVWTESMLADKPQPAYDPATKNTAIALSGARNEWVGFLICVRGDETLVGFEPEVTTTLTDGTNTIADSNTIPYFLFNHVVDERANAYEEPGTYPDAAVPYRDVYYNEVRDGTEAGWGQTVAADTTRVFFVETYIATTTPAGTYNGVFTLTSNSGGLTQDVIISIEVNNFELPDQWTLENIWGVYATPYLLDGPAFGGRNDVKAREYLFNMQKSASDHGFFLYAYGTDRGVSGPTDTDGFAGQYFDGANDEFSWKRFLDNDVPQGYNPKPYPVPSSWWARKDSGTGIALISNDTDYMDSWVTWVNANGYTDTTFMEKMVDEPSLAYVNTLHTAHVLRHDGHPERPMEAWTAGQTSYPPDSDFWDDDFKSAWMVSQFYTWYRAHDWGEAYGSPSDFDTRRSTYGDRLYSYTAGDNDSSCDRDLTYNIDKNCRAAASTSLDAYSRQNAYMLISDYYFGTEGHHFWMTNEGWRGYVVEGTADASGYYSIVVDKTLPDATYTINSFWNYEDGSLGRDLGASIIVNSGAAIDTLPLTPERIETDSTISGVATAGATVTVNVQNSSSVLLFTTEGTADGNGDFTITLSQALSENTYYYIGATWTGGLTGVTRVFTKTGHYVTDLPLPSSPNTVTSDITVTGRAIADADVKVYLTGTGAIDSADYQWEVTDPFSDYKMAISGYPLTGSDAYNGDGVFFYPGRPTGTDHDIGGTHEIPIESYKMKLVRWGAQVYEYAKLLEAAGESSIADTEVGKLITYNESNTISISLPAIWDTARETMSDDIPPTVVKALSIGDAGVLTSWGLTEVSVRLWQRVDDTEILRTDDTTIEVQ